MNLYNISAQLLSVLDNLEVDPDTGEAHGFEALEELDLEFEVKAEGLACSIKGLVADAEAIKAEKAVLAERQQRAEKKAEQLKAYLTSCMDTAGKTKLSTPRCSISFRKSERVEVSDVNLLPKQFQKVSVEAKKSEIKSALKNGEEIAGARLVSSRNILVR